MLTPNTLLRMICDAQRALGLSHRDLAEKAFIDETHWQSLRSGRRKLTLEMLPALAKAVKLSFQVVAPHHAPFMQLTAEEAEAVLKLAEHYKRNGSPRPHPLRSAVEKLTAQ